MRLVSGSKVSKYEIRALIGRGGMGEVYRAWHPELDRDVAIKILAISAGDEVEMRRRFDQEARTIAQLEHPNILSVFDAGQHEGYPFLVTELLEGETLRHRLSRGPVPWQQAVELLRQVVDGLTEAHSKGFVHRDLKPENLFVLTAGRIKILDFGLAKVLQRTVRETHEDSTTVPRGTVPGHIIGTVAYMSPEQLRAQHIDESSDVFSLGAVAYEMLTGARAFGDGAVADVMASVLHAEPASIADIPVALGNLLSRCLLKDHEKRPRCVELAMALRRVSLDSDTILSSIRTLPGGPVPSDAAGYVPRSHDPEILGSLRQQTFTMLVYGPVQCGKSTALALLHRKARESGIATAWFTMQPRMASGASVPDGEAESASAICELLQEEWNLLPPKRGPVSTIIKLSSWLTRELASVPAMRSLLILDDLGAAGTALAEKWLTLFIRQFVNRQATHNIQLSMAVGMADPVSVYSGSNFWLHSSFVSWNHRIGIGWFKSVDEIAALITALRGGVEGDHHAREFFSLFHGQPYLTHAALVDPEFLGAVMEWTRTSSLAAANRLRGSAPYKTHFNAVRLVLFDAQSEPTEEARRLVGSFCDSLAPTGSSAGVDPRHVSFLRVAKLLNSQGEPELPLYRLMALDFRDSRD